MYVEVRSVLIKPPPILQFPPQGMPPQAMAPPPQPVYAPKAGDVCFSIA